MQLDEHLFRRESARMVAALTRIFGVHNLSLAEDVVQDAFCRALEVWKVRGVPDNPSAWLMATAKNRALDVIRRERTATTFAPEVSRMFDSEWTLAPVVDEAFASEVIRDEQLRMMFSCCDPRLKEEVQIALVLNILCGFGAQEIAGAFLAGRAAVEKRIARGKQSLATSQRRFDLTDDHVADRLPVVQRALYLLFNEGYHSVSADTVVRTELCREAIRLTELLAADARTGTPATCALAALMCLHAARLPARITGAGELSALSDQDRSTWDASLIAHGLALLDESARGADVSVYHLEAAIAAAHVQAPSVDGTDWHTVVELYDRLLAIAPSPVVALNRAIAVAQRDGAASGIAELEAISDADRLAAYPFYRAAFAELELRRGRTAEAREHFEAAMRLARNAAERRFFQKRVGCCGSDQ
jgi:RNA polymerase sigma-70 factor (ECF subfamily)